MKACDRRGGYPGHYSLAPLSGANPHNDSLVAAEVLRLVDAPVQPATRKWRLQYD